MAYIWWKLLESDPKSEFSNGYNSVIFKVKIYDKISRHSELPREFKTAKIFQKKNWKDFFKNIWKSAIFNNWKKIFLKIADFQIFFKKSSQIFFWNIFAYLGSGGTYLNTLKFSKWYLYKRLSYSSERNLEKRTFAHPKCCVIVNGAIYIYIYMVRFNSRRPFTPWNVIKYLWLWTALWPNR